MVSLLAPVSELSKFPPRVIITYCDRSVYFLWYYGASYGTVLQIVLGILKCFLDFMLKWQDISREIGMPCN